MAKSSLKKEDQKNVTPQSLLESHLQANKSEHYNFVEEAQEYKVSTGSLKLDAAIGGGLGSGLQRFFGFTEGGKTSESLEVMRNFFITLPKTRGLLVKAEGRLSKEMQERSGIKFVWSAAEWISGTCFVLETNNYELVLNILRDLVTNNEESIKYCFVLDSIDALILKSDMEKGLTEAGRVAGGPMLTKKFLQRMAISMNKLGHMCIMIGQVSAKIEIDAHGPKDQRQISATGGNAAQHFSNFMLQFEARYKGDMIMEDDKAPFDPIKNRILGHWAKVIIKKSANESSNQVIVYPIKYGRKGGSSIWVEKEIIQMLIMFDLVEKKASWISLKPTLLVELQSIDADVPEQLQGEDRWADYLEENKKICQHLFEKFKRILINGS